MDWIEEKLEALWRYVQKKSLWKALVSYLCVGMFGVGALYWITRNMCLAWVEVISQRYQKSAIYRSVGGWSVEGIGSKEDYMLLAVNFFHQYCLYFYILVCFCLVGKIFLELKIKPAVCAISRGLNDMKLGDYSCEINWHSQDEMGTLCRELDQMRKILLQGKREEWRQQEEQRKINAAFAHDIRTPLTVLQGYTEFLQKYIPKGKVTQELLLEKLDTMRQQEQRLLLFSTTMTTIHNFEKWELSRKWHRISELRGQLEAVIQGLAQNTEKEICLYTEIPEQRLFLDRDLLTEVVENLLSNGLRYARQRIEVRVVLEAGNVTVFVKDDGPGFSGKALQSGMETYFSEEENSKEHFGIGLSICRMLCENHGGSLTLKNSVEQGAISAAMIAVGLEVPGMTRL